MSTIETKLIPIHYMDLRQQPGRTPIQRIDKTEHWSTGLHRQSLKVYNLVYLYEGIH